MQVFDEVGIEYYRPEGAYYVLADAPKEFEDGASFADFLLKKVGVAVLPALALYHDQELGRRKIRVAFCKKDSTLRQVERKLRKLVEAQKHTLKVTQST